MEIVRSLSREGHSFRLDIRVLLDDQERALVTRVGLSDCRIQTRDGPLLGRSAIPANVRSAFRTQFGRVKNRWSAAIVRTTGFVLLDLVLLIFSSLLRLVRALTKIVFGRRKTFRDAVRGISIRSQRVERIKEAEFFILVSIAAIHRAMAYAGDIGKTCTYRDATFLAQIDGLDFAGSGSKLEDDLEELRSIANTVAGKQLA